MSYTALLIIGLILVIGLLLSMLVVGEQHRAEDATAMDTLEEKNALQKMKIAELERDLRKARCNHGASTSLISASNDLERDLRKARCNPR